MYAAFQGILSSVPRVPGFLFPCNGRSRLSKSTVDHRRPKDEFLCEASPRRPTDGSATARGHEPKAAAPATFTLDGTKTAVTLAKVQQEVSDTFAFGRGWWCVDGLDEVDQDYQSRGQRHPGS